MEKNGDKEEEERDSVTAYLIIGWTYDQGGGRKVSRVTITFCFVILSKWSALITIL